MDKKIIELIKQALIEDGYDNDVTTFNLINKDMMLSGSLLLKQLELYLVLMLPKRFLGRLTLK